jgi:hypothetical protein
MMKFKKGSVIEAVRHMVTPSIGFTYSPDFSSPGFGYYKNYYNAMELLLLILFLKKEL